MLYLASNVSVSPFNVADTCALPWLTEQEVINLFDQYTSCNSNINIDPRVPLHVTSGHAGLVQLCGKSMAENLGGGSITLDMWTEYELPKYMNRWAIMSKMVQFLLKEINFSSDSSAEILTRIDGAMHLLITHFFASCSGLRSIMQVSCCAY